MTGPLPIVNPWIIVHEPDGPSGGIETILGQGQDYQEFGIVIADLIGHVARTFDVDEADVMEWVNKELDNRTIKITGAGVQ